MRIALAIGCLGCGGAERQCAELACQLKLSGHSVWLIYFNNVHTELLSMLENAGVPVVYLQPSFKADPITILRFAGFLCKNNIEVVHSFLFTEGYIARPAAFIAGTRVVIHGERSGDYSRPFKVRIIDRMLRYFTHHYIVNNLAGANYLANTIGVDESRISVIYNGIDIDRFIKVPKQITNVLTIVMAGRLRAEKNYEGALNIIGQLRAKVTNIRLLIAGDSEANNKILFQYKNSLLMRSQQEDLIGSVEWLGFRNDMPLVYANADIYLSTSHFEGCQNTMLEAMAAGLPVVVPDISDNRYIINNGREGFVIPKSTDTQGFVDALARLVNNVDLRKHMAENAARKAKEFSVDIFGKKHIELYQKLLDKCKSIKQIDH